MLDFCIAVLVTVIILSWGWYLTRKIGLLDKPGPDVPVRSPVPTLLWVWAIVALVVLMMMNYGYHHIIGHHYVGWLLLGSVLIWLLAFVDEMLEIRSRNLAIKGDKTQWVYIIAPWHKMIMQCIIVFVALYLGWVSFSEIVIWSSTLHFPIWLAYGIAVLWCVWFINAVNRFDGVYGLVSGMASIGFLTLYILVSVIVMGSYDLTEQYRQVLTFVSYTSVILAVIAAVSTVIEYKPLGILRDVGTMFFGFAMAYLALLWGAKIGTMIVVLSLVLFDAVRVLGNRLYKHGNPFRGDYTHLHHRLLANNRSRGEIRVWLRSRSLFFMILILLQGTDRINKLIICILMMIIFFGVNIYLFWIKKIPDHLDLKKKIEK